MKKLSLVVYFLAAVSLAFWATCAFAIDAVAGDPGNTAHWHMAEKTLTATFLGGDKPESAVLILEKAATIGRGITIESDGSFIVLQSGTVETPHIIFQVPTKADGTSSKLLLVGSDQPTLFFNDKEQVQQQGKWIQICSNPDPTLRLEIGTATFAKVIFDPPAGAQPVAATPVAPAMPAAAPRDLLHDVTARQLQLAADKFHEGVLKKCTRCNGTGKVTVQVQAGYRRVSANMGYPIMENRVEQCAKCGGTGIDRSDDPTLIKLAGTMVKDVAFVKEDDPKKQETLVKVYAEITDQMIGDERTWTCLTANGKAILAQANPVPGTTVVALVEVDKSFKNDGDHRRFLVRVVSTDKKVYVDDPVLADELKSGHALMGGLVDKPLPDRNGEGHITVLRGGFLIAPEIKKDWYWWYKDYK